MVWYINLSKTGTLAGNSANPYPGAIETTEDVFRLGADNDTWTWDANLKTFVAPPPTPEPPQPSLDEKKRMILESAKAYTDERLFGPGIGLVTLGVTLGKPKCMAVQNWIALLWTECYTRIAQVTETEMPNTDFSSFGDKPFTIQEMMAEVQG